MKKIYCFYAAVAMVLTACGGNKTQGGEAAAITAPLDSIVKTVEVSEVSEAQPKAKSPKMLSEEAVMVQLRTCFAEVNRMAAEGGIDVTALDKKYCSRDFLELKNNLEKKVQKGEVAFEGDEGYHWTADIGTPLTVDSVSALLVTAEQAQAEVWLKDAHGNRGYLELTLYLEDGAWKIHNWIDDDVYPFGALFHWMQNAYDGTMDDEEEEEE